MLGFVVVVLGWFGSCWEVLVVRVFGEGVRDQRSGSGENRREVLGKAEVGVTARAYSDIISPTRRAEIGMRTGLNR